MQRLFILIYKLYFILCLFLFSHIPSQNSTKKRSPCCPIIPSSSLLPTPKPVKKATYRTSPLSPYFRHSLKKRKGCERKKKEEDNCCHMILSGWYLLFLSPLLTSSKEKGEKFSVYKGWRGGRKEEEEDCTCHYRNFCEGSRTMRFFFIFSVQRTAKNGSFLGTEGMGRGERRGPWGTKPQGPVLIILFCF